MASRVVRGDGMTRGQRPEMPDNLPPVTHLWTTGDIAGEFGVVHGAVCNWTKRHDTFPQPVAAQWGRRFYDPGEVRRWRAGVTA